MERFQTKTSVTVSLSLSEDELGLLSSLAQREETSPHQLAWRVIRENFHKNLARYGNNMNQARLTKEMLSLD